MCVRTRGRQIKIFEGCVAVHSLQALQGPSKALTGFWLDALHVSLATAGRWREKEERAKTVQASSQAPASGDPRGEEAGGGWGGRAGEWGRKGQEQLH